MTDRRALVLKELGLTPVYVARSAATASAVVAQPAAALVQETDSMSHQETEEGIYFVTCALADSLPQSAIEEIEALPENTRRRATEAMLDRGLGQCALARPEVASVVRDALLHFDGERYLLHAWVIMPNHVHLVIEPSDGSALSEVMDLIKSLSAQKVNELFGLSASFWHADDLDRLVRDDEELARSIDYTLDNPLKGRLVAGREDYVFSSGYAAAGNDAGSATADAPAAQVVKPASLSEGERSELIARMNWQELKQSVATCTACKLHQHRKQAVFGVGDEEASWLFVGEGPGADEDEQGEPFVGQAGKLLDNMLAAIRLKRGQDVYIANMVKCRPPNNRNPEADEARACEPYLSRQIELIKPKLIIALGRIAAHKLLNTDQPVSQLRDKLHDLRGTPLIVTYHPAYLLRNLPDKAKAWADLCFAVDTMARLKSAPPSQ